MINGVPFVNIKIYVKSQRFVLLETLITLINKMIGLICKEMWYLSYLDWKYITFTIGEK